MSKCKFCGAEYYGGGCSGSPTGQHEHSGDETKCEFCSHDYYGAGCSNSPTGHHEH
jgi:hypothetical protein